MEDSLVSRASVAAWLHLVPVGGTEISLFSSKRHYTMSESKGQREERNTKVVQRKAPTAQGYWGMADEFYRMPII
jgi:hypothetical protein